MLSLQTTGKFRSEFVHPESNRFVADVDISLSQQIFNISNTEIEPMVQPNGVLNDGRWETVTFVYVFHSAVLAEVCFTCQYPAYAYHRLDETDWDPDYIGSQRYFRVNAV